MGNNCCLFYRHHNTNRAIEHDKSLEILERRFSEFFDHMNRDGTSRASEFDDLEKRCKAFCRPVRVSPNGGSLSSIASESDTTSQFAEDMNEKECLNMLERRLDNLRGSSLASFTPIHVKAKKIKKSKVWKSDQAAWTVLEERLYKLTSPI